MIPRHRHRQLHLFDANHNPVAISPEIRRRLLPLIIALLSEAASDAEPEAVPGLTKEAGNE